MKKFNFTRSLFTLFVVSLVFHASLHAQKLREDPALDEKVRQFLSENEGKWHDLNVPAADGQTLYDLIIKGNYKNALEIGTSTGHSGVWIAWALSKTGGKLITIEIDEGRYKTALANFKKAGVSEYIDARLADAHELVKELKGPFDFVFSDADKDWYKNYFVDVEARLKVGACFAAHNVSEGGGGSGQREFLEYVKSLKNYTTTVDSKGAGISISYKRAEK